jgi:hypothetical protein
MENHFSARYQSHRLPFSWLNPVVNGIESAESIKRDEGEIADGKNEQIRGTPVIGSTCLMQRILAWRGFHSCL